ncbi:hypothetical protein OUZ56_020595 [Daphnia magna]|uniref:Secreted protein n=1 Tax=Daphnia magna TaxID=35525 RepID=A0ABQ9ZEW6_9CRUS|nr:hypothetical protein OUZ56_020595 [Daphnia magna]
MSKRRWYGSPFVASLGVVFSLESTCRKCTARWVQQHFVVAPERREPVVQTLIGRCPIVMYRMSKCRELATKSLKP